MRRSFRHQRHQKLPCLVARNRLRSGAVAMADDVAFEPAGFLAWINSHRPDGAPEETELSFTAASVAAEHERTFRQRVRWWSG